MPPDSSPDPTLARTEHFQRVMRLFDAVVALDPETRRAKLVELCPTDTAVRREVEAMLAIDGTTSHPISAGGGIEHMVRLPIDGAVSGLREDAPPIPVLRGQYRIVRQIGEGGMGIVYEAEQSLPRRTVALKAVRAGFDSRAVLRRFEQEAHILGRLHHPGIAQIYEAGASNASSGDRAFIAMEFVDGVPLSEWARDKSVREKIALVATICDAVQHAHQRRVIHRDLKPANILVDKAGHAKILDFGVARLADADTAQDAQPTRAGQLVGTLPYMSPEQVAGDPDEIDARTDVWALGVILYELLAGRLPIEMGDKSVPQMALAIRDEAPPRLAQIDRRFAGDLDAITSMALAKERDRRYQSALELGNDLRRFLAHEPVTARQESSFYVLRKYVRRHRWIAASLALAVVSLAAFALKSGIDQRRADHDARELADALRASNIERGRLLAYTDNLGEAERMIWNEHLKRPDAHSHWALWDLYSKLPCERSFPGHTDAVMSMAMSPDGSLLVTGSHDSTARVWDWKSGKNVATHPVDGFILGVGFLPDGARMCCATQQGSVTCWDARTGAQVWQQNNLMKMVFSMCTARNRPIAAIVSEIDGLAVLDLQSGEPTAHIGDKRNQMRSAAFDSTGHLIAAGGNDKTVRLFDVDTGAELRQLTGHPAPIEGIAFDAQDARVASGDAGGLVLVHDVESGRELARLTGTGGNVRSVEFSRDGKRLLVTGQLGVEMWDLDANEALESRAQFRQHAFAATFAPGDQQIVSGSLAGAIRVWEIESDSAVRTLPNKFERQGYFAIHPDGRHAARDEGEGKVEVVDLDTGTVVRTVETGFRQITQVLYEQPGGNHLALLSGPTKISIWDGSGEHHLCSIETETQIGTLRFSPDGKRVAVTTAAGVVRLYEADTGAKISELHETESVMERPAFSPDGKRLATTHRGKLVEIWQLDPPRLDRKIDTPRAVYSITFDPRGEQLWVGTWDGHVLVYGAEDGQLIRTLEGHVQQVSAVIPRRDGSLFVTTGGDGVLRLWSRDAPVSLVALDAHAGNVLSFLITADGQKIRSIYFDGTVRDWDLSYYDRHIAGNESSQRARLAAENGLGVR